MALRENDDDDEWFSAKQPKRRAVASSPYPAKSGEKKLRRGNAAKENLPVQGVDAMLDDDSSASAGSGAAGAGEGEVAADGGSTSGVGESASAGGGSALAGGGVAAAMGRLRFQCVHCETSLEGLETIDRIRHIMHCAPTHVHDSPALPAPGEPQALSASSSSPAAAAEVVAPPCQVTSASPTPPAAPGGDVSSATAGATPVGPSIADISVADGGDVARRSDEGDGAARADSFRRMMDSARTMWTRQARSVKIPSPPPPPPPPRDALQALMQAATAKAQGDPGNKPPGGRAATADARGGRGRGGGRGSWRGRGRSLAPFKRIEGTRLVVDGFTCAPLANDLHFLTHFHADHYMGISKRWTAPIYASAITAALVVRRLGVPAAQMVVLPMDVPSIVCGVQVTLCAHLAPLPVHTPTSKAARRAQRRVRLPALHRACAVLTVPRGALLLARSIDANHCPGAVLLLFEFSDGRAVLHTGDFRYRSAMARHAALGRLQRPLDALYLDTTYCDPRYRFPTQAAVVQAVVDRCQLLLETPRTLVLFGSYSIGKERVFLEVGRQLGVRVAVDRPKWRLLECCELSAEDAHALTTEAESTRWRVVPMAHLRAQRIKELVRASGGRFTGCVAFRPTGWCFKQGGGSSMGAGGRAIRLSEGVTIVEVPYSEHSSFDELRECVHALQARKIVSTVGGGPRGDAHPGVARLVQ